MNITTHTPEPQTVITITLSEDEAKLLRYVIGHIGSDQLDEGLTHAEKLLIRNLTTSALYDNLPSLPDYDSVGLDFERRNAIRMVNAVALANKIEAQR